MTSAPDGDGFRQGSKRFLAAVLPRPLVQAVLSAWRRLFWWNRLRIRPRQTQRYVQSLLRQQRPIKLELGSGRRAGMEEWVSLDLNGGADIQHDLTQPLPFPNDSVDRVYSSHVLEHFTYPNPLLDLLRECHRVLRPGGTFSIAVPNAQLFLKAYFHPEGFDRAKFCSYDVGLAFDSRLDVVNFIAFLGDSTSSCSTTKTCRECLRRLAFAKSARGRSTPPSTSRFAIMSRSTQKP